MRMRRGMRTAGEVDLAVAVEAGRRVAVAVVVKKKRVLRETEAEEDRAVEAEGDRE